MNRYGITARIGNKAYSQEFSHDQARIVRSRLLGEHVRVCKRCEILLTSKFAGIPTNGFCETCFDEIMDSE